MKDNPLLTDIPLDFRIKDGSITAEILYQRSLSVWNQGANTKPIQIEGEYGCPICYSKMDKHNRLVVENGYVVCDYCVYYVENYLRIY